MDRLSVGIILPTLGDDQVSQFIVSQLNQVSYERQDTDYIVYLDFHSPMSATPKFAIMHNSEITGHFGPMLCMGIKFAPMLLEANFGKYMYLPNLEHRNYNIPKTELSKWFCGPIKLIAESEKLAVEVEKEFELEENSIVIIPQFNMSGITQYLHDEAKNHQLPFSFTL